MPEKNLAGKKAVMIVAFRNFRDAEYFVPKEILEKAGVEVKTASNKVGVAIGAEGGDAVVDFLVKDINSADFDAVIFVGGPGCLEGLDNDDSYRVAKDVAANNKVLAAICVSPVILAKAGVLQGKKATVWSSMTDKGAIEILEEQGVIYIPRTVVVDNKIITGNGPAAANEFSERVIELLTSE